jgi:hypothetical protein
LGKLGHVANCRTTGARSCLLLRILFTGLSPRERLSP